MTSRTASYFEALPLAQSEISQVRSHGQFVSTVERAFRLVDGTEKSQCSLAVYEFADQLIKNVWYYPAYACK